MCGLIWESMCRTTGRACSLAHSNWVNYHYSILLCLGITNSWLTLTGSDSGSTCEFSIMLCWHSQRREKILKASIDLGKERSDWQRGRVVDGRTEMVVVLGVMFEWDPRVLLPFLGVRLHLFLDVRFERSVRAEEEELSSWGVQESEPALGWPLKEMAC